MRRPVFPAWYGRGPNHRLPLVPRRMVSRVDAANGRVTGRRPDRNGRGMPDRQCVGQAAAVERRRELSHKQSTIGHALYGII